MQVETIREFEGSFDSDRGKHLEQTISGLLLQQIAQRTLPQKASFSAAQPLHAVCLQQGGREWRSSQNSNA